MPDIFETGFEYYSYIIVLLFGGEKVDVNYKNLNEFNRSFKLKFEYFGLYLEININDPNFLFHISKMYAAINLSTFCSFKV